MDLDGDVDATDKTAATNNLGTTLGWGTLSAPGVGNRKGYGGYELDPVLAYTTWHVRNRVLLSDLGRWITRDPIGYRGGMNLYQYVSSNPLRNVDPFGLLPPPGGGELTGGFGRRPTPPAIYPPGYGLALVFEPCATRRPVPNPIAPPGSGLGFLLGGGGLGSLQGLGASAAGDSLFSGSGSNAAAIPTCGSLLAQYGIDSSRGCDGKGCFNRCMTNVPWWRKLLAAACPFTPFSPVKKRGIPGTGLPGDKMQLINRWPWYRNTSIGGGRLIRQLGRRLAIPLPITLGSCGAVLAEMAICAIKCRNNPCRTRF